MTSVTVQGSGLARTTPDEATLELSVEAVRPTPAEALAEVAERGDELVRLCGELGIGPERRVTSGATVAEHGDHVDGRWQHLGYRAESRLLVRVDQPELAGRLLAAAVDRARAKVAGPWWTVARDNPARLDACREAALDARRKAGAYAEALGARLGAIVAVREPGTRVGWPEPRGDTVRFSLAAPTAAAPPALEGGELAVSATVEVEWALEQG
jgi:uncharacterized protein YggE